MEKEYEETVARLSDPAVLADRNQLREASKRHKELDAIVGPYRAYRSALDDLATAKEMLGDASPDER